MGRTPKGQKDDRLHLTDREVSKLIDAATDSRNPERDRCLLLLAYRHGFRVSELCALAFDQVDTEGSMLHIKRLKRGYQPRTHYAATRYTQSRYGSKSATA